MSNKEICNGDLNCLNSKLIRQRDVEELAGASEVTVTFDQMTEKEAYYLLMMLRQDNAGYQVKRPRSIKLIRYVLDTQYTELDTELDTEYCDNLLAKQQEI